MYLFLTRVNHIRVLMLCLFSNGIRPKFLFYFHSRSVSTFIHYNMKLRTMFSLTYLFQKVLNILTGLK